MRIFADENIQEPTVHFLRELGHDVEGVRDLHMETSPDAEVYAYAQETERALLTYNADFVDIRALRDTNHHGVIRLRIKTQRIHALHPVLRTALERLVGLDLTNTLVTISDRRTRIRKTTSP